MNGSSRMRMLSAAAIIAPVLLVKGVEFAFQSPTLTEGHAGDAGIMEEVPMPSPTVTFHSQPSPRWNAASAHVATVRAGACPPSPFLVVVESAATQPEAVATEEKTPEVLVQMIMSTREGPVALIGGKPRRVGEAVDAAGMWFIRAIDPAARTVQLEAGTSGRFTTVGVERRGSTP